MRQIVVDATRAQMQEDMDNHIATLFNLTNKKASTNKKDTTSLAQVTRMAQATLNHAYGGQDGKGTAKDMMTYLSRKGSYLRCCIS